MKEDAVQLMHVKCPVIYAPFSRVPVDSPVKHPPFTGPYVITRKRDKTSTKERATGPTI